MQLAKSAILCEKLIDALKELAMSHTDANKVNAKKILFKLFFVFLNCTIKPKHTNTTDISILKPTYIMLNIT